MMHRRLLAILMAGAMLFTACGDDDEVIERETPTTIRDQDRDREDDPQHDQEPDRDRDQERDQDPSG